MKERPLGISGHRGEDNIKMDIKDIGCHGIDWIMWVRIGTSTRLL
jgi:hypothetical protein